MSIDTIVVDTREKKPYKFPGISNVVYKQLDVGDYTYEGFEHRFAVERKSLDDLANSLGNERDRFEYEIERAQDLDEFAVVIEAPRSAVENYAGTKHSPNYYSKIYPNSILATVDKWPQKEKFSFVDWDFHWCGSREGAKQETLRFLDKWYLKHGSGLY